MFWTPNLDLRALNPKPVIIRFGILRFARGRYEPVLVFGFLPVLVFGFLGSSLGFSFGHVLMFLRGCTIPRWASNPEFEILQHEDWVRQKDPHSGPCGPVGSLQNMPTPDSPNPKL